MAAFVSAVARKMADRVRTSPWTSLLLRGCALGGALLILAWVGRSAIASSGPPSPASSTSAATHEMAAVPVSVSSAVIASPPQLPIQTPSPSAARPSGRATVEDPVYVNHANVEELRRLPGVGAKRAEAIVQLRQKMGRFQRVEDLLRVKGIGRATLRKWRPLVRLDSPPAPDAG